MSPEAKSYLDKATEDIADARKIFAIKLYKVASRAAYYAAFHAAEALICERNCKVPKTHSGVRAELALLIKMSGNAKSLITFLARAYKYKEISDYGIGHDVTVTESEAAQLLVDADSFVKAISDLMN